MRVLVVGTLPAAIGGAEHRLRDAGHEVVRCHQPGDRSFPCAGLVEDRGCPIEAGPVDVVVTARDRSWPRPSPFEDGAVCALRRHVPLVVLGHETHPFEDWAARTVDDPRELSAACEEAASTPLARHGEVAGTAAREVLEVAGFDPRGTTATVRHARGRLTVDLVVPAGAEAVRSNAVARVATELRVLDPHAPGIDISVSAIPA